MKQSKFPAGWDAARVQRVLAHYEQQSEDVAVAEDEAAAEDSTQTLMAVPREMVPAIRELIAKHGQQGAPPDRGPEAVRARPQRRALAAACERPAFGGRSSYTNGGVRHLLIDWWNQPSHVDRPQRRSAGRNVRMGQRWARNLYELGSFGTKQPRF